MSKKKVLKSEIKALNNENNKLFNQKFSLKQKLILVMQERDNYRAEYEKSIAAMATMYDKGI